MRFVKEFWLGLKSYWDAVSFIHRHRLYWYFLIPLAMMLVIYHFGNRIMNHHWDPDLTNMNGIVWYFVFVAAEISIAMLLMKFTRYFVVILLSPLLSHLSQYSEKLITGKTYPIVYSQILSDVKRGFRLSLRNMLWEYFFFLIIFLISFIGWNEPKQSPIFYLTFIIGFYYYGFSFIDYDNERRKRDLAESVTYVRDHRGLAMGIGMIYSLMILVPVNLDALFSVPELIADWSWAKLGTILLNFGLWVLASIAPIFAVVSATLAMKELQGENDELVSD